MPGWYTAKTKKITMERWGRDDLYAAFIDPNSLPYGRTKHIREQFADLQSAGDQLSEQQVERLLDMLVELLAEWNMEHPETGEEMPKPENGEGFGALPQEILLAMVSEALGGGEEAVPLENGTSPEPPQKESDAPSPGGTETSP
jgi:hypothetical protein